MNVSGSVLFVGSPYWCNYLSELFNDSGALNGYTQRNSLKWLFTQNKSICLVGLGPPDTLKRRIYHYSALLFEKFNLINKRVIYWIGSDVSRLSPDQSVIAGSYNIAGSNWLVNEVKALGYECRERLFPVALPVDSSIPPPQSRILQVLCYLPDEHRDLHGAAEIVAAAEALRDAQFSIVGGTGKWWSNPPDNVRFLGWVDDLSECIGNSHVLLRRTSHDSFSAFVREGLVAARHVFFTYDVPGATYVARNDVVTLISELEKLAAQVAAGNYTNNTIPDALRQKLTDLEGQLQKFARDYD